MRTVFILFFSLLTACHNNLSGTRTLMSGSSEKYLQSECSELNTIGSYANLRDGTQKMIKSLIGLLDQYNSNRHAEILSLIEQIEINITKLNQMTSPRYFNQKWDSTFTWEIKHNNLPQLPNAQGLLGLPITIKKTVQLKASRYGIQTDSLKDRLSITTDSDKIKILLNLKTSSIELCDLQNTLMIGVRVYYSINNTPLDKTFTLTLNPEAR